MVIRYFILMIGLTVVEDIIVIVILYGKIIMNFMIPSSTKDIYVEVDQYILHSKYKVQERKLQYF